MKRSNRLVLLVGVFLAIVAFVGILVLVRNPGQDGNQAAPPPTTGPVVVAAVDLPLSTRIQADQITTITVDLTAILPGAFTDPSQVIGQVVRQATTKGAQVTAATVGTTNGSGIHSIDCPVTMRCMAVQVDQVSGVGTVIKTGDYVDMVVGLTSDKFPVITVSPVDKSVTVVTGLNSTSVKLLLQGMQVMGTLLPTARARDHDRQHGDAVGSALRAGPRPTSTGSRRSSSWRSAPSRPKSSSSPRWTAASRSLSAPSATSSTRSPAQPLPPTAAKTTGVTLKVLVDSYGVLPPEVVQTVTPAGK